MTSSSNTPDPSTTPIEWLAYGAPNAMGKTAAPSLITPIHTQNMVGEQRLSVDQILHLMNQINASVKAGDFSTQLANNIFLLCQQLKNHGQHLEQTNKNDLNRVFVSLRQACCRDSGQLGTPCRLKMMELVELRAMGWRPNLAHTQYYLNRPENVTTNMSEPPPVSTPNTASPYTPIPINPFNQYVPPPQQLFMHSEIPPTTSTLPTQPIPVSPGYFLIPAGGGWSTQMVPANPLTTHGANLFGAANQAALRTIQNPLGIDPDWASRNAAAQLLAKQATLKNPRLVGTGLAVPNVKSNKSQQFREEITIRNSDSGKIMGVKGRRVAVVEELSKTVISFQKVDPKSKDRVLTITGSNEESLQYAKKLIEETIRRNVSPNRPDQNGHEASQNQNQNDAQEEDDAPGISIETGTDGTLKLCCDDPEVLQAAQAALSEYLNRARRKSQMTPEERELRKERRKSMPLQPTQQQTEVVPTPSLKEARRVLTGSTPNLADADELKPLGGASINGTAKPDPKTTKLFAPTEPRICYERTKLFEIREQDEAQTGQREVIERMRQTMPEILRNAENEKNEEKNSQ
jgi:hypothetical protein